MTIQVTTIRCPSCTAPIDTSKSVCEFCGNKVMITSFSSVANMPMPELGKHVNSYREALAQDPDNKDLNISAGMCFLKLKLYDQALAAFEKAMPMNFDNSEVFFYAAVCLLEGKMPFLHLRPTIDRVLSYVNSALSIETRGIYYYFLSYVKYDYFKRKFLITNPDYAALLNQANAFGVSETDKEILFSLLGTQRPACL